MAKSLNAGENAAIEHANPVSPAASRNAARCAGHQPAGGGEKQPPPAPKMSQYHGLSDRLLDITNAHASIGIISSRLGFYLEGLEEWRRDLMCDKATLRTVADLGYGVLDAMVETAAYTLDKNTEDDTLIAVSALTSINKQEVIAAGIEAILSASFSRGVHLAHHASLRELPGGVLAYWLPASFLSRVLTLPRMQSSSVEVFSGLQTDDDFRFLRAWWECPYIEMYNVWFPFAKGGEYQPYSDDLHLVVNWAQQGAELKAFVSYLYVNWSRHIKNTEQYFKPGLTYTERTTSDISVRAFPSRAIFSVSGPVLQSKSIQDLYTVWALTTSRIGRIFIEMAVGSGDSSRSGTAARHYRTGVLKELFWPQLSPVQNSTIRTSLETLFDVNLSKSRTNETHLLFSLDNFAQVETYDSYVRDQWAGELQRFVDASTASYEVDKVLASAFGILEEEIEPLAGIHPASNKEDVSEAKIGVLRRLAILSDDELVAEAAKEGIHARTATKKSYFYSRRLELIAAITKLPPLRLTTALESLGVPSAPPTGIDLQAIIASAVGMIYGRWDIRYATGKRQLAPVLGPFSSLPICPPSMLQNSAGLPASADELPEDYPLRITWSGILVDDLGHPEDIEGRVQESMRVIWRDRSETIEQEACILLGVPTLREYLVGVNNFFADHLSRQSKSRRVAPLYWPLSTASGSYTIWLYYQRLTDQTLYRCVNDFIDPRRKEVAEQLNALRRKTGRGRDDEQALERLATLDQELTDFRAELLRVAAMWKPNLNDGVQITAAPLYRLFNHRPWRKRLQETWEKLVAGEYDWAHLAYSIWPDRVREKCRSDKSLAIAHNLEQLYVEPSGSKSKGRRTKGKPAQDADTPGWNGAWRCRLSTSFNSRFSCRGCTKAACWWSMTRTNAIVSSAWNWRTPAAPWWMPARAASKAAPPPWPRCRRWDKAKVRSRNCWSTCLSSRP